MAGAPVQARERQRCPHVLVVPPVPLVPPVPPCPACPANLALSLVPLVPPLKRVGQWDKPQSRPCERNFSYNLWTLDLLSPSSSAMSRTVILSRVICSIRSSTRSRRTVQAQWSRPPSSGNSPKTL